MTSHGRSNGARRRMLPVLPGTEELAQADPPGPAPDPAGAAVRVGVVTLGCDKNTVDSERTMARLLGAGAAVSTEVEGADVVVVNTCGFIEAAKEESIGAILEAARLKESGRVRAIVAIGCLVQRYETELQAELPEVDLFLGVSEADRLVPELRARGLLAGPGGPGDADPADAVPADAVPADAVPTMERPLRVLTSETPHASYLKISEGCDHSCAFCAIPLMRGKHRSTPIDRLVREAQELEARGVVELNLVSQDTTWYGRDLARRGGTPADGDDGFFMGRPFEGMAGMQRWRRSGSREGGAAFARGAGPQQDAASGAVAQTRFVPTPDAPHGGSPRPDGLHRGGVRRGAGPARAAPPVGGNGRHGLLPDLLRALLAGTSIPWFRLFYMYPSGIRRELVELLAREDRLLPYLDMPIQHGADTVLERMRRPERRAVIRERVAWLREAIPELVLRTTVIVGFPGETEEEFAQMFDLLEELRFDRVGAFAYSQEEGTRAATMSGAVPEAIKRDRLERLLDLERSISLEKGEAQVGRDAVVLVDRCAREGEDGADRAEDGSDRAEDGADRAEDGSDRAAVDAVNAAATGRVIGRTMAQAREVDGVVHLADPAGVRPRPGTFVRARITGADESDLMGRICQEMTDPGSLAPCLGAG